MSTKSPNRVQSTHPGIVRWKFRPGLASRDVNFNLDDPDKLLAEADTIYKNDEVVTVVRLLVRGQRAGAWIVRRLNYGRWRHRLRDLFRASRVERNFRDGLWLEQAGIATARPLAVGVRRVFRWPRCAYLITEEVPEAVTLKGHIARRRVLPSPVIRRLAELVAQLHEHQCSHRDLKGTNVLLDGQLRPWLIDLDGIRRCRRLGTRRAQADLKRLAAEFRAQPLLWRWGWRRFLRRYCEIRQMPAAFREWDRVIAAALPPVPPARPATPRSAASPVPPSPNRPEPEVRR